MNAQLHLEKQKGGSEQTVKPAARRISEQQPQNSLYVLYPLWIDTINIYQITQAIQRLTGDCFDVVYNQKYYVH